MGRCYSGDKSFSPRKNFYHLAKEDGSHGSLLGDPCTIVCLSIQTSAQLRRIDNDEIHVCFYINPFVMK